MKRSRERSYFENIEWNYNPKNENKEWKQYIKVHTYIELFEQNLTSHLKQHKENAVTVSLIKNIIFVQEVEQTS